MQKATVSSSSTGSDVHSLTLSPSSISSAFYDTGRKTAISGTFTKAIILTCNFQCRYRRTKRRGVWDLAPVRGRTVAEIDMTSFIWNGQFVWVSSSFPNVGHDRSVSTNGHTSTSSFARRLVFNNRTYSIADLSFLLCVDWSNSGSVRAWEEMRIDCFLIDPKHTRD